MWWPKRRSDEDFRREIDSHIAIETDRLIAEGVPADEARGLARRKFGNVTAAAERFHESRRVLWFDELRQDVRYALRSCRRTPGFTAVAIVTLALGLGANTAIFSVVNAVLLHPLPYRDPGSLVFIEPTEFGLSPGWAVSAWRARAQALSGIAGFTGPKSATLVAGSEPVPIDSAEVTPNFFGFLGTPPAMGRDFTEADGTPGTDRVAIVSHDFWMRLLDGNPDAIGRAVTVSGVGVTIVGVLPDGFRFPTGGLLPARILPGGTQPDLVLAMVRPIPFVNAIGRLGDGISATVAGVEMRTILRQEANGHLAPSFASSLDVVATPLQDRLIGDVRTRLWLVTGAVAFVLLVACANVANLLLTRASTRQREMTVRAALGARRGRLARLVLTESVLLALAGSAGSLLLTFATRGIARTLLAARIPYVDEIAVDWWVLGFNTAAAVLVGVLCGVASIPRTTHVHTSLAAGSSTTVTGRTSVRAALLSVEVGLTFVLVVGAALLVQTMWNLTHKERGFDPEGLLTARVSPGLPKSAGQDFRSEQLYFAGFFTDLTERLKALPGVSTAAAVSTVPFAGTGPGMGGVSVEGRAAPEGDASLLSVAAVTPGYFRTMRIALAAGRDFDERDRAGAEPVAIVNQAFRTRFAQGGDIIGSRIGTGGNWRLRIVGLVDDVPERSLRDSSEPLLFFPLQQMAGHPFGFGQLRFVVRATGGDPRALVPLVRRQIWSLDRNIVIDEIASMDERVAASVRTERDSALLFGLFAVLALIMAVVGVYGVAAYATAQRTREFGIRAALGARARHVRTLVLVQTLWPTVAGLVAGLAGAAAATRFIASMIYGVTPLDGLTFAGTGAALAAAALAASYIPARRASGSDPLLALRHE